jgi:hypothetical protein
MIGLLAQIDPKQAADSWLSLADRFGFPAALVVGLLVIIVIATIKVGRWAAPRADKLLDAHLAFIGKASENTDKVVAGVGDLEQLHGVTHRKLDEIHTDVRGLKKQ